MAVAHVVSSASHASGSNSVNQSSFSWTHTTSTDPQGVLVLVFQGVSATDAVSSVTYDGVTVPAVSGGRATDTATEPGSVAAFYLGSSVPTTNNPTVQVNRTSNTTTMWAVCATVTAAKNTEATGVVLLQNNGAISQQSVDDGSPGSNSVRYAGVYYGGSTPAPAGANSTLLHSNDAGAYGWTAVRETTAGQGSRLVGCTQGTSDDRAAVHFAIREASTTVTGTATGDFGFTGEASGTTGGGGMALAVDASTPALAAASNDPWVTASFTPPVDSLIVLVALGDWFGGTPTLTPTSTGLTFTSQIKAGATNRGVVQIWTSEVGAAGGTPRTISCTTTIGSDVGGIKAFVLTGYDTAQIVDTTNSGQGSTDPLNPTVLTTSADGCWVLGGAVDWNAQGAPSSTDVFDAFSDSDLSFMSLQKSTATSPAGEVTFNLDSPGNSGPLWQWAAISIRPSAGGTTVEGAATGDFGFTGTGNGVDRAVGAAAGVLGFAATGAGVDRALGAAAAALGFTGTAAGVDRAVGQAATAFGFTATASGTVGTPPVQGQAGGAFGFTATGSGVPRTRGTAAGTFGFTGSATGVDRALGIAAAALGFVGAASGVDRAVGTATGAFGFTGTASGALEVFGVAAALLGFTGAAQGFAGTPPVTGTGSGLFGFTATAQGRPRTPGTGAAGFGFAGTANGRPRVVAAAVTTLGFTGIVVGVRAGTGAAVAAFGFTGTASGQGATVSATSFASVTAFATSSTQATVAATSVATVTGH